MLLLIAATTLSMILVDSDSGGAEVFWVPVLLIGMAALIVAIVNVEESREDPVERSGSIVEITNSGVYYETKVADAIGTVSIDLPLTQDIEIGDRVMFNYYERNKNAIVFDFDSPVSYSEFVEVVE